MLPTNNSLPQPDKLSKLAGDAAVLEKEGGGFMNPGVKRGRGRPKGSKNILDGSSSGTDQINAPAQPVDPIQELRPLTDQITKFYSGILVQIAEDEKAALDSKTQETMSHTSAVCMQQYFPNAVGKHAALIVLLCIVGQTSFNAYQLRSSNLQKLRAEKAKLNGDEKLS